MTESLLPFMAPPTPKIKDLDVLYIASQIAGCSWYRCSTPEIGLRNIGYKTMLVHVNNLRQDMVDAAKVVVWLRPGNDQDLNHIKYAKERGKLTVIDFDDDLWNIDYTNPAFKGWNDNGQHHLNVLVNNMKEVDLITTTTNELIRVAKKFNKNTFLLPNMLVDSIWEPLPEKEPSDKIIFGWAGSTSHYRDLKIIAGDIQTILNKYPNVYYHSVGLPAPIEHEKAISFEGTELEEYRKHLASFDISLAPVMDTVFNQAKSDLKFLEAAAVGVPTVASDTITYSRTIKPGENGFLAKNSKGWLKWISYLIENEDRRKEIGLKARKYAETRFISRNIHLWEEAYGLTRRSS